MPRIEMRREKKSRTILLPLEFTDRFTVEELRSFEALAQVDNTAFRIRWSIQQASEVDVTSPLTMDGVTYLALNGVLTLERATEVLAPAEG